MELHVILLTLAALLIVVSLVQPVAARLALSSSVLLAVVGVAIGLGSAMMARVQFGGFADIVGRLPIHANVFLDIFLPLLLFESALNIEVRQIMEDAAPILLLAVVAVVVATLVIGVALAPIAAVPTVACFMLGSIVATTDPVAVIAIFHDVGAPARLSRLVEGESLLNDAAAITLFVLLLNILVGAHRAHAGEAVLTFGRNFVGGILVGYCGARLMVWTLRWVHDLRLAQVTLTLALPYCVYIVGEHQFEVSGVVAAVTAGLVVSTLGQRRMAPDDWRFMHDVWEQLAFWASSLIFILAALLVPRMLSHVGWKELGLLLVLVSAALAARALVLFGMLPLLTALRLSQRVDNRFKAVIAWGGLRGAVTLALALAVTENPRIDPQVQDFVGILATGFVLFTLLINGTTLRTLIRLLGLDRLSPLDQALRAQVLSFSRARIAETVAATAAEYRLTQDSLAPHLHPYAARSAGDAAAREDQGAVNHLWLGLLALAHHERALVLQHFEERTISGQVVDELLSSVEQLIDRTRSGGREEYLRQVRQIADFSRRIRLAHFLHRRCHIDALLVDRLADRFELLLIQRILLGELDQYLEHKLSPLLGEQDTAAARELLAQRHEMTATALAALREQYPAYAELLEGRVLDKLWLRREATEYRGLFEEGIIGPELYSVLRREVDSARAQVELRPRLDLGLETRTLIAKVPIFANLNQKHLDTVARLLRPRFSVPGERIIRDGDSADAMYFICSGRVEVRVRGRTIELRPGDFFGELALVSGQPRQGDVIASTYCQLLTLKTGDFRQVMRSQPEIKTRIEEVASGRLSMNRDQSELAEPAEPGDDEPSQPA